MAELGLPPKLLLLGGLYFAQGLPYGFFTQTLPVVLRQQGVGLREIGFSSLLALPWALKFLWAPWVDRTRGGRLGRRRAWLLPLQAASIGLLLWLAACPPEAGLGPLLVAVFLANLVAATQDVAADGLAVELLAPAERGLGNGLQVAAYRAGMIVGGGLILVLLTRLGWSGACVAMALGLALASWPTLRYREPPREEPREEARASAAQALLGSLRALGPLWLLALGGFKAGDALGSAMLRPFLVDRGLDAEAIGLLLGVGGFGAGLIGALLGGALAGWSRRRALIVGGVLQASGLLAYLAVAWLQPSYAWVVAACAWEHLVGGVATAALFTLMMDACREAQEATDYTLQASAVVLVGGLGGTISGVVAQATGYAGVFGLGALGCVLGALALLGAEERRGRLAAAKD